MKTFDCRCGASYPDERDSCPECGEYRKLAGFLSRAQLKFAEDAIVEYLLGRRKKSRFATNKGK